MLIPQPSYPYALCSRLRFSMDVESALASVGGFGRGQLLFSLCLTLLRVTVGLNLYCYTFVKRSVGFVCYVGNVSYVDSCPESNECNELVFDETDGVSLVSTWSLVCKE